jgi:hypothetical protein
VNHQITLVIPGVHTQTAHFVDLQGVFVDTLPAGGDLQPVQQQIEAQRQRGIVRIVHGVEGAGGRRVVGDEYERRAAFLDGPAAQKTLLVGLQVGIGARWAVVFFSDRFLGLAEGKLGHRRRVGQRDVQHLQHVGVLLPKQAECVCQHAALHRQISRKLSMKPISKSMLGVFVEVAAGVVGFRPGKPAPPQRPGQRPAPWPACKIGGFGQKGLAAEIVQPEKVGAAFGPSGDDLGE